ncbi:hypothetical protein [Nodosilinea sp. FACHB-13]|uniref:hypothetical protein n=1 Tax=Nodosilinea sp. FACHB-13 TaxID=2692831 RepID=UPI001683865B|nr:hypothetical protein [Nodosilinea sp. FACHB-13]
MTDWKGKNPSYLVTPAVHSQDLRQKHPLCGVLDASNTRWDAVDDAFEKPSYSACHGQ